MGYGAWRGFPSRSYAILELKESRKQRKTDRKIKQVAESGGKFTWSVETAPGLLHATKVRANTKSEARARFKDVLGGSLPKGFRLVKE
jgi:hypothetical protein